jgi:N-(2-amino-2-carboxyethyl)-L-glutamate synthase
MDRDGVLKAVGNTPLVRLRHVLPEARFRLYAKLELLNPGGSSKDRAAANIIQHAIDSGRVERGTTVVESSSGNMGVGLAQICSYLGLRFVCVTDPKISSQTLRILRAYGAEIDLITQPDLRTGEYLPARIRRVQALLKETPNSFWPNQYANVRNAEAHYRTMHEIAQEIDGAVDYLFVGTSSCGTLRGCAEYVRRHNLPTSVTAVDALGSVIFDGRKNRRLLPGLGAAVRPELCRPGLADRCVHVSDLDCVVGCRRLVRHEGILAGGSTGGILMAVDTVRDTLRPGASCVAIFPDRGERYLDTIYSDSWVAEHFGDVAHLWDKAVPVCHA